MSLSFASVLRSHALLALLGTAAPLPLGFAAQGTAFPHIVTILVDDMGYGDPGCYNPRSKIATPHIDRLAREGLRFTDAHAPAALCHPSRYGFMTGAYPFRTDVSVWPRKPLIQDGQMTIASLLRSQGYRTAMVGKWHLGFQEDGYDKPLPGGPVDRGFETFFGFRASTDIPPYFYVQDGRAKVPPTATIAANASDGWSPIQGAFWREGGIAPGLDLKDVLPRLADEAVAVIRNHAKAAKDRPLFLHFAPTAPHTPWLPSPEFSGRSGAGMYGDFAMMTDAMIGRILQALDESGMAANTLVLLTSDNGPVWYPEDVKRLGHDSAGGLRGMKADAWEAGHRMPFVVRWPGHVKPGTVTREVVCFTDLLATFAELVGVPLPPDAGPDSFSFLSVLRGTQPRGRPVRESLVVSTGLKAIRMGPWKLIAGLGSGGFSKPARTQPGPGDPVGQLYNLDEDPGETKNLYAEKPDVVARLLTELGRIEKAGRSRP